MIFNQNWSGVRIQSGVREEGFFAEVPGNIQYDYAVAKGFRDVYFADGCRQFEALEDDEWEYSAKLTYGKESGERVWFVSRGIDYKYRIFLNGDEIYGGEGMFSPVELDLTERLIGEVNKSWSVLFFFSSLKNRIERIPTTTISTKNSQKPK